MGATTAARAWRPGAAHLADLAALAVLVALLWYLAGHDGGRPLRPLSVVVALGLVATPLLIAEVRLLGRGGSALLAWWALAPVAAAAAASYRAGMVRPLLVMALAGPALLAARRIWRQSWGPAAIGILALGCLARLWYPAFLAWWGAAMGGGQPQWLALSWHNQSGTVMGALGLAALGAGLALRGVPRSLAVVAAAAGFAGMWLSGSRGAAVLTLLVAAGLLAVALRNGRRRDVAAAAGLMLLLTSLLVVGLAALTEAGGQPLAERDQAAGHNLRARVGHAEAALRMAGAAPLTGHGPGSYRWASLPVYPEDTNLTSSAHNEYLEVLGEGGLLWAIPVWGAALAVAGGALRRVRRPPPPDRAGEAALLACLGVGGLLGLHAGMDFDWSYALLLGLLATAAAPLLPERADAPAPTWLAAATVAVVVMAGSVAVAATVPTWRQVTPPWEHNGRLAAAVVAARDGQVTAAREQLAVVRRWNPGSEPLRAVTAVVEHAAGTRSDQDLAAVVEPGRTGTSEHLLVADRLVEVGAHDTAQELLDLLRPVLDRRRAWGVRDPVTRTVLLELRIVQQQGSCVAVTQAWQARKGWLARHGVEPGEVRPLWPGPCPLPD